MARLALAAAALLLAPSTSLARDIDCVDDLSLETTATQANLTWTVTCETELKRFKVYYDHVRYKACDGKLRKKAKGGHKVVTIPDSSTRIAILDNLEPFSFCKFELQPIPTKRQPKDKTVGSATVKGSTAAGVPRVARLEDTSPTNQTREEVLVWSWAGPDPATCDRWAGRLGAEWEAEGGGWQGSGQLPGLPTRHSLTDLKPGTAYTFRLYLTTAAGRSLVLQSERRTGGVASPGSDLNTALVIGLVLAGLAVVVAGVGWAVVRCRRHKAGYRRAKSSDYSTRQMISTIDNSPPPVTVIPATPSLGPQAPPRSRNPQTSRSASLEPPILRDKQPKRTAPVAPGTERVSVGSRGSQDRQSMPLPPIPGEPLYEVIPAEREEVSANPAGTVELDEEQYMVPRVASVEDLDEEGYLVPNFNRFQPMDTRSPSLEPGPTIPMVSYASQSELTS